MFRPTHFVILFAVVLCATAFPAAPETPEGQSALAAEGPVKGQDVPDQSPKLPIIGKDEPPAKGDLDTDATVHFGFGYYGPRWGGYYGPGYIGRSYGWGPYGWF